MDYIRKFSVIIPHKNCPQLLKRCLSSIPFKEEIEIIVVDDNSDDISTLKKIEGEIEGCNIRLVLTTEGKGAGYARNVGLTYAIGEWILFADADDFFENDAFDVFDNYTDSGSDIVYFPHRSVYSDTLVSCNRYSIRNKVIEEWHKKESDYNLNCVKFVDLVPWSKMFRKEFIDKLAIRFDEVPASNDVMFVVQAAAHARHIRISSQQVYVLTYRNGSITRVVNRTNNFSRFKVSLRYNNYMDEIGHPEMKHRVVSYIINAWCSYGLKEACLYLREAHINKQGIITGLLPNKGEILNKVMQLFHRDNYQG